MKFRFYNLAGNPMMAKLAEGVVDVVFDIKGQAPHDVVPGAFIAMKAGALLWDIKEGKALSDSSLIMKILNPDPDDSRIKVVWLLRLINEHQTQDEKPDVSKDAQTPKRRVGNKPRQKTSLQGSTGVQKTGDNPPPRDGR